MSFSLFSHNNDESNQICQEDHEKEEFFCDIISDGDSIISKVIFQTNKDDSIELEFEYFEQIFTSRFIW
jgi:hypothetical protein